MAVTVRPRVLIRLAAVDSSGDHCVAPWTERRQRLEQLAALREGDAGLASFGIPAPRFAIPPERSWHKDDLIKNLHGSSHHVRHSRVV